MSLIIQKWFDRDLDAPAGGGSDVSVSLTGSAVTVWYATGLTSDTPVDASRGSGSSPTSTSALTTVAGGFIAAAATCRYNSGTTRTHSWTNATEIFDLEFENTGTDGVSISAAYVNPTDGSSITLTDTLSVAGSVVVVAANEPVLHAGLLGEEGVGGKGAGV